MDAADFKIMKKAVADALLTSDDNNPIWYAGYLWINLTKSQAQEMVGILLMSDLKRDYKYIYTPSGLGVSLHP